MAPPLIFVVAGEPSGDALGAELIRSLVAETGGRVEFAGVGGPAMEEAGLDSLFPMSDLAVMGLIEVLPRLVTVMRRLRQTVEAVRERQPALVVTIDAQAFSHQLARRLHPSPCALVHYVAPTVWAWRPWRAKSVARVVDRLLLLFPFEKPFWDAVGQDAVHVGHPLADARIPAGTDEFRASLLGDAEGPLLAVLPGSRKGEVKRHLAIFGEAVTRLAGNHPGLAVVMPSVSDVAGELRRTTSRWRFPVTVLEADGDIRRAAMAASDAALAVSGTVTLDLAAAGTPHVVAYRANPLTAAIVRRMVTIRHASLVNLTAGREVTPEYIQERCTADRLCRGISRILADPERRASQVSAMKEVMTALRNREGPSSRAAARSVLALLGENRGSPPRCGATGQDRR